MPWCSTTFALTMYISQYPHATTRWIFRMWSQRRVCSGRWDTASSTPPPPPPPTVSPSSSLPSLSSVHTRFRRRCTFRSHSGHGSTLSSVWTPSKQPKENKVESSAVEPVQLRAEKGNGHALKKHARYKGGHCSSGIMQETSSGVAFADVSATAVQQ